MVAADVHGKNHHRAGCFGSHVRALRMRVADGRILECSREVEPDLFRATVGGMGLTGHILEVEFPLIRVPSPWIVMESERIEDIDQFIAGLKAAGAQLALHAGLDRLPVARQGAGARHPDARPVRGAGGGAAASAAAPAPARACPSCSRAGWWGRGACARSTRSGTTATCRGCSAGWSRRSGSSTRSTSSRTGTACTARAASRSTSACVPDAAGHGAARRFLELLTARGGASFLCVIKDCGPEGFGLLSFPLPGISIALDIPINDRTQSLVDALNELVIAEGGRIYLAKDALTRPEHFQQMEPRLAEWTRIRRQWDPAGRLRSAQSVRVLGDAP